MFGAADQLAQEYLRLVKLKDSFISAACPFHKGGQEKHPSFWVNRYSGEWGCFTCQKKGGNLKDLLKELGVRNHKLEAELEEAAKDSKKAVKLEKAKRAKKAKASFKGVFTLPDAVLGVFDWEPLTLIEKGFDPKILEQHDVGFDRRINRITFPVRDIAGSIVGISGRTVDDGIHPKYLFYSGKREREGSVKDCELGEWYPDYSNSDVRNHLWRGHLVYPALINSPRPQLIIVEGFKAGLWVVQCGWDQTVATMGTKMTPAQERIIRRLGAEVFVLMDNNEPGRTASHEICQRLAVSSFPVYECSYPKECSEDAQPDDLSEESLEWVLSNAARKAGRYVVGLHRGKRRTSGSKVRSQKHG